MSTTAPIVIRVSPAGIEIDFAPAVCARLPGPALEMLRRQLTEAVALNCSLFGLEIRS